MSIQSTISTSTCAPLGHEPYAVKRFDTFDLLTDDNYHNWKIRAKTELRLAGHWEIIQGTTLKDIDPLKVRAAYDAIVRLLHCSQYRFLDQDTENPQITWKNIESFYANSTIGHANFIEKELLNKKL